MSKYMKVVKAKKVGIKINRAPSNRYRIWNDDTSLFHDVSVLLGNTVFTIERSEQND